MSCCFSVFVCWPVKDKDGRWGCDFLEFECWQHCAQSVKATELFGEHLKRCCRVSSAYVTACWRQWSEMMMGDQFRSKVEQYSPKSSPRGARSPVVARQDSTGTLKTTISLGKNPSIVHSGPFYLMKEPPGEFTFLFINKNHQFA